jgi:hypothetical protein
VGSTKTGKIYEKVVVTSSDSCVVGWFCAGVCFAR